MPPLERTLTQKTTSGVAWSTVLQVSRQGLSLVSVTVLARKVPPSAYGLVAMSSVFIGFFENLRDLGTTNALVRLSELTEKLMATVFWLNCVLGLMLAGLTLALSSPVASFFHQPDLAAVIQAMGVYFIFAALGVLPNAMLTREMAFRRTATAQFVGAMAGTATAIALALMGKGVWSLVFGSLVNSGVTTAGYWIQSSFRIRWVMDLRSTRSIMSYSLNLSASSMVNYFTRNADNLIVGRFLGSVPLGYYQMGYTFLTFPLYNFSAMIAQVLFPAMAKVQDDDDRIQRALIRTSLLIALFTFPSMIGLFVTADPFVRVVLGSKWLPVIGLLQVFAPLGAGQSVATLIGLIYTVKGRTDLMFRWGFFFGVMSVLSFLVGLRWGIQGVAVSYAILWSLLVLPGLAIAFRLIHLPLGEYLRHFWPIVKPTLVMAALAGVWLHGLRWLGVSQPAVLLASTSAVGVICYVALLFWWKPPTVGELRKILEHHGNPLALKAARLLPLIAPEHLR